MKKKYVKPEAIFESFELSSSIAAGCEYKTNHALEVCTYQITGGRNVFVSPSTGCNDITAPEGDYNGICYQVPSDANNLFTS